jgi:hypothetical protein
MDSQNLVRFAFAQRTKELTPFTFRLRTCQRGLAPSGSAASAIVPGPFKLRRGAGCPDDLPEHWEGTKPGKRCKETSRQSLQGQGVEDQTGEDDHGRAAFRDVWSVKPPFLSGDSVEHDSRLES